jgi:PleD family two-component response regulator
MENTLLIVEDDLDTSEMLRVYFEGKGYRVVTAISGVEALEKCRSEKLDLVLLDVRMKDVDGFTIGQQLQSDVRTSQLPIIFVTERGERDDRITGLKLGAVDYIAKPFDIQELRLRVRNALRRVRSQNNPITGLPGEKLTTDRLGMLLERETWAAIGVNISGLDKFNEIYGFVARDDVLRAIALTLTTAVDELGSIDDFVGQPGENCFVITTVPDKLPTLGVQIEVRLNQAMTYFYPIHDREAGYVVRNSGDDPKITVPFMSVSVAKTSCDDPSLTSVEALFKAIDQL